jgi:hypothetical protein
MIDATRTNAINAIRSELFIVVALKVQSSAIWATRYYRRTFPTVCGCRPSASTIEKATIRDNIVDQLPLAARTAEMRERFTAVKTLVRQSWGADNPAFRQLFTSSLMPTATKEQMEAFNELQRLGGSPEGAVRYMETVAELDVSELLPQVKAPTLVMHV